MLLLTPVVSTRYKNNDQGTDLTFEKIQILDKTSTVSEDSSDNPDVWQNNSFHSFKQGDFNRIPKTARFIIDTFFSDDQMTLDFEINEIAG